MGEGRARKFRRAKPARSSGCQVFGILNPYGNLWTWETFASESEARDYVRRFWLSMPGTTDLSKFKVIPVKVTVSDARPVCDAPSAEGGE